MAAEEQPTEKDKSTEDMWDINRKVEAAGSLFDGRAQNKNFTAEVDGFAYDSRIQNQNQKGMADAQTQALFWQNIQERQLSLKLSSQELLERSQNFWQTMRQQQDQHHAAMSQAAVLNNIDENKARALVPIELRTVEPKESLDTISESIASAVQQGVESVARAQTDRTQTSAANIAELTGARQVADTEIINTLAQVAGVINTMQTQAAATQASYQSLASQVAELVGTIQALTGNQPKSE